MNRNPSSSQLFTQMLCGAWITQGIYVAAELRIADLLVDCGCSVKDLATATDSDEGSLYRLLRALSGIGLLSEDAEGRFSLTPLGEPLLSERPDSQRALAIMMGAEFYEAWGKLLYSVRTGRDGFRHAFGAGFFDYMTDHPDRHQIYDAAMHGIHGVESEPISVAYDFSSVRKVVDIGGGNGSLLSKILKLYPNLKGVLFDLPSVAERASDLIGKEELERRCRVEGGDFFLSVPEGADCYLLRHILHDWIDEQALQILGLCREAMRPDGKILVVENLIPSANEPHFSKWLDLMMLLVGGKERTKEQFRYLFEKAGLRLEKVIPTTADVSILVAVKA